MTKQLVAPFPYYGSKRRYAKQIWECLGDPQAYVEPFCGSAAVLLNRPESSHPRRRELINDLNIWVTNFFRSIKAEPESVANYMSWPSNELDLAARQKKLSDNAGAVLRDNPDLFDVELAGVWAWGMSCSISGQYPNGRMGAVPFCKNYRGANQRHIDKLDWCNKLKTRLEHVQVVCGDWERSLSHSLHMHGSHSVGIFIDPPYDSNNSDKTLYIENNASKAVASWAIEHGSDYRYRIILCGFELEHEMPSDWNWVVLGQVGRKTTQKNKSARNNKEGMWLSPHCLSDESH